jgi:hypothetical protein
MITFNGMSRTETSRCIKGDPRMLQFENWRGRNNRCAFPTDWIWSPSGSVADDFDNRKVRNFFNVHYVRRRQEPNVIILSIDTNHTVEETRNKLKGIRKRLAQQIRSIPSITAINVNGPGEGTSMRTVSCSYLKGDEGDQAIKAVHKRFGPEITRKIKAAAGSIDAILGSSRKTGR